MTKLVKLDMNLNQMEKFPFSAEYLQTHLPVLQKFQLADNMIGRIPNLTVLRAVDSLNKLVASSTFIIMSYSENIHVYQNEQVGTLVRYRLKFLNFRSL